MSSDFAAQLAAITKKKQLLASKEEKLIGNRKQEIGSLAEKLGLLAAPEDIVAGIFCDLKQALDEKLDKLKTWEALGAEYLQGRSGKEKTHRASNNT